jgi:hypothetical protein
MPRPVWLLAPAILVAAMACGHGSHAGSQGTEITFYLADSGRHVTVNVGDSFTLNLGSSSDRHWVISDFPRALLSAPAEHRRGEFTFAALAPGRGQVAAINTFACPPATVHGCSKPEPGNSPNVSPAVSPVPGVFILIVDVVQDPVGAGPVREDAAA